MTTHHRNQTLVRAVAAALASAALSATMAPHAALAQDVAAPGATPLMLEEVVVTAQRREQALQDVPITLQVVGKDLLNDVAAEDMGDLNGYVPGLVVSSNSPTQPKYQIRGIQTADFGVGTDSAVGVYIDGIYSARSGSSMLAFNDIERIEVLKGPQGTLFGRNSAAGAVSIVTRQPTDEFDASVRVRAEDYNKHRVDGMVNIPVADNFAVRVNALWNESDGWVEDAATGKDLWPEENWATRIAARWELSDATTVTLSWDHDELDQFARPAIGIVPLDAEQPGAAFPADPATYLDPLKAPVFNDAVNNEESRKFDGATLFIDHSFAWADFRSSTAFRQFETANLEDEDGTNRPELYFDTANIEDNESFYQEFKFSGDTGAFDWVAGGSWYSEKAKQTSDTHAFTDSIDTLGINLGVYESLGLVYPDGTPIRLYTDTSAVLAANGIPLTMLGLPWREAMNNEGKFEAVAVFGDVIWHATDKMNLTFGLRYTHDEKEFTWQNGPHETPELDAVVAALEGTPFFESFPIPPVAYRLGDIVFPVDTPAGGVKRRNSWDDLSPRFVVDYKLTPDVMVFGSVAKGYKAGGFNSVEVGSEFDNEDVWNYEAGVKSVFADIGLVLNASTYYYVYQDKQAIKLVSGVDGSGIPQYVIDTSDEEAFGVEVDARWQPLDALTLMANAAWIDATYKKKSVEDEDGIHDLSGEPTGEPYFSASLGASYVWTLGSGAKIDASAMHAYRGSSRCNAESELQGDCSISPVFEVGEATNRTDVRLAWTDAQDRWGAAAYVTNAFDNRYVEGVNNLTRDTFGTPFSLISEPRIWGVEAHVNF